MECSAAQCRGGSQKEKRRRKEKNGANWEIEAKC